MKERSRAYDSVLPAALHLAIAVISFIAGLIFLIGNYPPFFNAALTFAMGFLFEHSIAIMKHVQKKERYCKRIRLESLFGLFAGVLILIINIIVLMAGTQIVSYYELLAIISLIISAMFLAIIGTEVIHSANDYLKDSGDISPVVQQDNEV